MENRTFPVTANHMRKTEHKVEPVGFLGDIANQPKESSQMKYQAIIAAIFIGFSSVGALAADSTDNSQQRNGKPEAARGGEPSDAQSADKRTGGQQSDAYAEGQEGKHKTGQASSAQQTDAQTSDQNATQQSGASPEAARKTGQAANARDSKATSQQNQQSNTAKDRSGAVEQEQSPVGANDETRGAQRNSPREPVNPAYLAELKKCDSMQGTEKQQCVSAAKKKAGQM